MDRARIADEVRAGPGIPAEELVRKHVALEPVTRPTGRDQVSGRVRPSLRHGVYVIERGNVQRQWDGAVDAASAAIAHGSVLEGTLDAVVVRVPRAAGEAARSAGERDSVETTSRHCTSLERKTPRDGAIARAGCRRRGRLRHARRSGFSGNAGLHKDCRRRSLIGLRGRQTSPSLMRGMSAACVPFAQVQTFGSVTIPTRECPPRLLVSWQLQGGRDGVPDRGWLR